MYNIMYTFGLGAAQYTEAVVYEQAAGVIELGMCAQEMPEAGVLLSQLQVMRTETGELLFI
jgi:hypothetical protein